MNVANSGAARHNTLLPALALLTGQLSVNLGAAVAKHLFPVIGVEGMTAYRVGFAALILLAIFRPWRTPVSRSDAINLAIYGSVTGLMNLLIYRSFNLIPIGVAVAIEVAGPLTVAVLSSRRPRDFAAVMLAVVGLYFLLPLRDTPDQLNPVGVAYALAAAVCWATYIVIGKRVSLQGGQSVVAWGMLAASVLIVPVGIAYAGAALLTPAFMLTGLVIAILSSAVPYSLEMLALRGLSPRVFSMLSSTAPAVGAIAGMLVLGEHLNLTQWLAIGSMVAASALTALR
jgi:inner membrane transporter RhtA